MEILRPNLQMCIELTTICQPKRKKVKKKKKKKPTTKKTHQEKEIENRKATWFPFLKIKYRG